MTKLRAFAFAAALLTAAPCLAQTPLDPLDDHSAKRLDRMEQVLRELRAIVYQGRETGKPVVVEPADTDARLGALSDKITDLEQSITRLTGQMEESAHALDEAQHEADSLREENGALKAEIDDLKQRLDQGAAPAAGAAAAAAPQAAPEAATPPPPPNEPAAAFAAARQAFEAHDYPTAEAGFHDYVDRFGDTVRGPEARYFLAKTLLVRQAYADAAAQDVSAIRLWPQTAWAPDAVLDLAEALIGLGKPSDACAMLAELDRRYAKISVDARTRGDNERSQANCGH